MPGLFRSEISGHCSPQFVSFGSVDLGTTALDPRTLQITRSPDTSLVSSDSVPRSWTLGLRLRYLDDLDNIINDVRGAGVSSLEHGHQISNVNIPQCCFSLRSLKDVSSFLKTRIFLASLEHLLS
ncbi:hypothetical protein Zmor_024299 [Zophobas morio]|uniref:Uncharacterized protein n=1 Tax=Zophobas morio TaxID=2755281 RepID=A0AA38I4V7_9CUCU|nr:hypothetical protein Zmor_024299 [Zophobas morio]